jgi:hypothetical protein
MGRGIDFEVLVSDYSSSVDEWKQAQMAPKSDLPPLNKQQREVARKMGVSEEDYQRNVLAGQFGEMRLQSTGEALGKVVQDLLHMLGPDYRLDAVNGEMINGRWVCRIRTADQIVNVTIPREMVDDALESGTKEELERLRDCLLVGLGHGKSRNN